MLPVHRVVEDRVGCPESDKRDSRLHQNAFENMPVHVMPKFVGQYGFDFIGRVVRQQRVRENDAARIAQSGEGCIGLLAFF